jgi:transposase
MLRELRVSEMRYRAVLEVLDGAVIGDVARRYGVSRQTVHAWLRRYARDGAVLNLEDHSSRPHGCPHQMAPAVEARVLVLRDQNPRWGPTRIVYELTREGVGRDDKTNCRVFENAPEWTGGATFAREPVEWRAVV